MMRPPLSCRCSFLALCLVQLSCSPQRAPEPSAPPPPSVDDTAAAPSPKPAQSDADAEAEMMRQIEEQERLADAEAQRADGQEEFEPREVVYRMSAEGMKIQVDGAEFRPKAEAFKIKGGYGVRVTVEATSAGATTLLNPNGGPLAFGGFVRRPDKEKITDERKGQDVMMLEPGAPRVITRSWPGPGQSPVFYGQKLELQVGLWGLGKSPEERRPVLKFFSIRMRPDGGGAQPIIEPPHN